MAFHRGQRVLVRTSGGERLAFFQAAGEPSDAIEVGDRKVDVAWVTYADGDDEGSAGRHPYADIRIAPPEPLDRSDEVRGDP